MELYYGRNELTRPYHGLTPAEHERLAWLNEELHEVGQAIGKIMRHGYDSYDPTNPDHEGNRNDLVRELMDVLKAAQLMFLSGDFQKCNIDYHDTAKFYLFASHKDTVSNKYMHEQ